MSDRPPREGASAGARLVSSRRSSSPWSIEELIAKDAFDVLSSAPRMVLGPRAGAYRVASEVLVEIAGGERVAEDYESH